MCKYVYEYEWMNKCTCIYIYVCVNIHMYVRGYIYVYVYSPAGSLASQPFYPGCISGIWISPAPDTPPAAESVTSPRPPITSARYPPRRGIGRRHCCDHLVYLRHLYL